MNDFKDIIKQKKENFEKILKGYLPKNKSKKLTESMEYSILNGGKRLRPIIISEVYNFFSEKKIESVNKFMVALEVVHCFSLVHDDLPAIDNDDLRRGKPTNHKLFGEDIAILTGDAMLNYAYELAISSLFDNDGLNIDVKCEALNVLSETTKGMIVGETLDVIGNFNDDIQLFQMYDLKTCALMKAAFCIGAILAGVSDDDLYNMGKLGYYVGMAFQLQDDILDIEGDAEKLGKPIGSDEANKKDTLLKRLGKENINSMIKDFNNEAMNILKNYGDKAEFLKQLVLYLANRES